MRKHMANARTSDKARMSDVRLPYGLSGGFQPVGRLSRIFREEDVGVALSTGMFVDGT